MAGGASEKEIALKPTSKSSERDNGSPAATTDKSAARRGVALERYFTTPGVDPYTEVDWDFRSAIISGEDGRIVFEQKDVEVPRPWSQTATNVVVSKYFRGPLSQVGMQPGAPKRETSVRQLISRVVDTVTGWGEKQNYFPTADAREIFHAELTHLLLNQKASFNSPVYFNVGIEEKPQCSACFILKVDDNMESILGWYRNEGMIFKGGSGAGVNLSALRSCREKLSSGGTASGPLSFMKAADASAGVIKSGGKTRRAAKMVVLNADHPDIERFIKCKVEEERKAWALIEAGYDSSLDGDAYGSVFFQNANNSVRATDEFMQAVLDDGNWNTRFVKSGEIAETIRARDLIRMIAEAAHACGDPGMQFDTTINLWHTCPASGRINASNPCSEYMHLDNSACNLASLNLMKFIDERGEFDVRAFRHAVDVMITAQDIVIDNSSYPTDEIGRNAVAYRELGLGYANLGALLMALGMPYDSEQGRSYAAAITALMTGEAYLQSARIAEQMGPFAGYAPNREPMLKVIERHRGQAYKLDPSFVTLDLLRAARESWDEALKLGTAAGYRNSQATVIAPTGTIAFMMDCDTTGIEPDIALIKYKKLVGGGMLKIVNNTVPRALKRLGYDSREIQEIVEYLDENETIEGAPQLADAHLPVFDCAFKPRSGSRTIQWHGHLKMMGAVQPFISGAISKTINMPAEATVDEVAEAYLTAWKLGLKAVAIYRDGSKRTQPLNTGKSKEEKAADTAAAVAIAAADEMRVKRRKLPDERNSITHKFDIAGHEGYITVGMYEDGSPGEIFVMMSKQGSTISGLMDSFATAISYALQYGVPLQFLVDKFAHMRFEPSGFTKNPQIPFAKSIVDYLFRWMASKFLDEEAKREVGIIEADRSIESKTAAVASKAPITLAIAPSLRDGKDSGMRQAFINQADAPPCPDCGSIMVRNGSCYKCMNCGSTSGCS
ncbi:MAG: vitamin B12-dependent ribonucleotide reductase [Candidatus Binatus sp.]|uniref:vitamin B12-dependent ribonucleotide reductase n=1 Tax=Candidatus Binatus sp. TaxID=2811406 RepID=UPI0027259F6D|nr:vitamin B12-dependent ribonucleotide reductase [Candidatus Binatus sp.]MDO8431395.1 vitamin B12-dependent ribonucleotide reductase [Candidatus Binatus sp.]